MSLILKNVTNTMGWKSPLFHGHTVAEVLEEVGFKIQFVRKMRIHSGVLEAKVTVPRTHK